MSFSRFRARCRMLAVAGLSAAFLFGFVQPSPAGLLLPGTSIANVPVPSIGGIRLADTGYLPYLYTAGALPRGSGFVREMVISGDISNPFLPGTPGALTFIYQAIVSNRDIGRVSVSDFTGFATDASAVTAAVQNPLLPIIPTPSVLFTGTTAGGGLAAGLPISRSADGSTVGFNFDATVFNSTPATADQVSVIMIVRTDATAFRDGLISPHDGSGDDVLVFGPFAPVPEPTSMALLGIGIIGMAGYGWRRRRTERKQDAMVPTV